MFTTTHTPRRLPQGHTQQEHETSHGSMAQTRWAIDGVDETGLDLGGRRFSSNDDGGPMMCNLVCSTMGRHVHIDYCRTEETTPCGGAEIQHIDTRMIPNPDKPKDAVTHSLYWRRMGTLNISVSILFQAQLLCRLQRSWRVLHYPKIHSEASTQIRILATSRSILLNGM